MIISTEAIVLKSFKYGDTSKIINFFTKDEGLVTTIAKGVRSRKNKFGASLDPISHIFLTYYKYPQKDLHLLSNIELYNSFKNIKNDFEKLTNALALSELILKIQDNNEKNTELFELICSILKSIDSSEGSPNTLHFFIYFQIELIRILGFFFDLSFRNLDKILDDNECIINFDDFSVIKFYEYGNNNKYFKIDALQLRKLIVLSNIKSIDLKQFTLEQDEALNIIELLNHYISYHLDKKLLSRSFTLLKI